MGKLIIDATTGTVLDVGNCYIVEAEHLVDDTYSDSELAEIAEKHGKSVYEMGLNTGWGDNAYRYTVSYSPLSIRDEANAYLDGGVYAEADEEYWALRWAGENAEIEELAELADEIMSDDAVWDGYKARFVEELRTYYAKKQEEN